MYRVYECQLLTGEVTELCVLNVCQDVKLRSRAYVAMGRIGKRLPLLFSADISLVQSLFDAMSEVHRQTEIHTQTQTDRWTDTRTDRWTDTQTDRWTDTQTDRWTHTRTDRWTHTRTDRWTHTRTDRWTHTRTDRWTHRHQPCAVVQSSVQETLALLTDCFTHTHTHTHHEVCWWFEGTM